MHYFTSRHVAWAIVLTFLACVLQPVANAQSDSQVLEAVRACQRVTELSFRIACYDRALPPIVDSVSSGDTLPLREERAPTIAESLAAPSPEATLQRTVQIVEVEMPSISTTRFRAADGRVFVRANARTLHRWPNTPFDVEIETGVFGSTFLTIRETGLRFRVAIRD